MYARATKYTLLCAGLSFISLKKSRRRITCTRRPILELLQMVVRTEPPSMSINSIFSSTQRLKFVIPKKFLLASILLRVLHKFLLLITIQIICMVSNVMLFELFFNCTIQLFFNLTVIYII